MKTALIVHQKTNYLASMAGEHRVRTFEDHEPVALDSPLIRLIDGVWQNHRQEAFSILRNRIYTNYKLSELERATLKLTAKRASQVSSEELDRLKIGEVTLSFQTEPAPAERPTLILPEGFSSSDLSILAWAQLLQHYPFQGHSRPILALLLDEQGKLMFHAFNTSDQNRLHHAEVNLCLTYLNQHAHGGSDLKKVPANWLWLISLKPCRMCAEWIRSWSGAGADAKVFYIENDPGPWAQHSILRQLKKLSPDDY